MFCASCKQISILIEFLAIFTPMKSALFLAVLFIYGITAKAQVCDTVYRNTQYPASYAAGQDSLQKFVFRDLTNVIVRCKEEGEDPPTKLFIELTIDYTGTVVDVHFRKPALSHRCEMMLCNKLIGMKGWKPARHNDKEVCSIFIIPVNCIKWQ